MSTQTESKLLNTENKYRKTYRAVLDISKSLDEIYKSPNSFLKIFQPETTLLREKLRQYCETLIFRQPLEFGKKAEEILWRKVFYEIIHIVKSSKKNLKSNSEIETMYRLHLSAAYGYYNHLVLRLQIEYNVNSELDGFLDFPIFNNDKSSTTTFPSTSMMHDNIHHFKEIILKILHKFLICLGDLARYQIEYDPNNNTKLSRKYYFMAMMLIPENGQPLNQLGTLTSSQYYGCDSAYYYLYCLSCTHVFHGAKENLKLLFLKNRKRYDEIKSVKYLDDLKQNTLLQLKDVHSKEIKRFLVLFLYIIDLFLSNYLNGSSGTATATSNMNYIQELCQICLQEFNSCMFFKQHDQPHNQQQQQYDEKKLTYLPNDLIFKLTLIILMTIERMKKFKHNHGHHSSGYGHKSGHHHGNHHNRMAASGTTQQENTLLFTAIAFAFVFFSHIINHSIIRFQYEILNLQKPKSKHSELDQNDDESREDRDAESEENSDSSDSLGNDGKRNKKIRLLYGRRRRQRNSDSELDSADSDTDYVQSSSKQSRVDARKSKKYLDTQYLSEDELNNLSTDFGSDAKSDSDVLSSSSSSSTSTSSSNSSTRSRSSKSERTINREVTEAKREENLTNYISKLIPSSDVTVDPQKTSNFKEFSTKLFTNYSMYESKFGTNSLTTTQFNENNEFIDDEIYKSILSGQKQVSVPPGFENNEKETREIEELGKKLATFQIETDTEMSLFNSDTNLNTSSSDSDEDKLKANKKLNKRVSAQLNQKEIKIIVDSLHKQGLLPSIKIICDWLLCNKKLIQSISQVSQTIWSKLAVLLNCIPLEREIASPGICQNNYVRNLILKSFEKISWNSQPLSEDIQLRSFDALKFEHSTLKFDINNLTKLNSYDETLLRLCCLRRFGYLIASLSKSQTTEFFRYDVMDENFVIPSRVTNQNEEQMYSYGEPLKQVLTEKKPDENRKLRLMKDMAQLRLQAEISQLERSYKTDELNFSPYIVPEVNALCNNLKLVQDLSRANKFIIIIPLIVIDCLDFMKKDSKQAREAIRWLESQFKLGNRFIRAQVQNEKIVDDKQQKSLKQKDIEQWRVWEVINCCKYFKQQELAESDTDASTRRHTMVTLLTDIDLDALSSSSSKSDTLISLSNKESIDVKNIVRFYENWKSNAKKK